MFIPLSGTPLQTSIQPGMGAFMRTGMGCAGGHCSCGGACKHGMGLFDSGFDVTGWGWQEWLTVAGLAYVVSSVVGDTSRTVKRVRRTVRSRRSRARRRAALREALKAA